MLNKFCLELAEKKNFVNFHAEMKISADLSSKFYNSES